MYEPKFFSWSEFDSPDIEGSGIANMDHDFVRILDKVREIYGRPIRINSGYRSIERNRLVGGAERSSHLYGVAADLGCDNSRDRHDLLQAIISVGITRMGIHDKFIHVDIDQQKSSNVTWLY